MTRPRTESSWDVTFSSVDFQNLKEVGQILAIVQDKRLNRRRRAFAITETELKLIAAAANIGFNNR